MTNTDKPDELYWRRLAERDRQLVGDTLRDFKERQLAEQQALDAKPFVKDPRVLQEHTP